MTFLEKAREPGAYLGRSGLAYECWPEIIAVVEAIWNDGNTEDVPDEIVAALAALDKKAGEG